MATLLTDLNVSGNINVAGSGTLPIRAGDQTFTGSLTGVAQTVVANVDQGQYTVIVSGTFDGTIVAEHWDGSGWAATSSETGYWYGPAGVTTASQDSFVLYARTQFRVRMTAYTSGTASVTIIAHEIPHAMLLSTTNTGGIATKTYDSNGTGIDSLEAGTGFNALATAQSATNYVLSTANSTTAQLTAGATFTGTIETIWNQQDISVLLTCDQNGILTMRQYIDAAGTRVVSTWTFPIQAGVPFSRSFVGNGNYFNLTFQNATGVTTTTLNINVAYGTIRDATNMIQLTGSPASQALGLGSTVTGYGTLRVTEEPNAIFSDPFDGTVIDVTDRWNAATVTGMTVTQATGNMVITTTTVASNSAFIDTKPTFAPLGLNFTAFAATVKLEAQTTNLFALNQRRFWGFGDRPTTFNATTPHKNSYGFEIDIDGKLYCCVYSNGTLIYRTASSLTGATLNSLITPSTGFVRFGMAMRADTIIWYVNSTEVPAASYSVSSVGFTLPDVQALPLRFHAVNAGTGTIGASTFVVSTLAVGDTGSNAAQLADGNFPWRRATIKAASTVPVAADGALVVTMHPSSPSPNATRANRGVQSTSIVNSSAATTCVSAGGVGVFRDLTNITISNATATATNVTISDGTTPVIYNLPASGGLQISLSTPRKATNANVAWTATLSVATVTVYVVIDYINATA